MDLDSLEIHDLRCITVTVLGICRQAISDQRMNSPTAFVENSATCPKNGEGEAVLPDGTAWRKFVLLYMAVMKTLSKADECMETGQSDARYCHTYFQDGKLKAVE